MKKVLIIITILILIPLKVRAADLNLGEKSKSAVLMEASTGEIIYEKNSNEKLSPASMTKMMTMLLVIEAIEKGVINWNDIVTVSNNASKMGGSQILLETNEQMSVEDLFKGVAIASGNDAAVALAEKIAGTESIFVSMMNERAKSLGMNNTNFKNVHGLDATNHYSTAYDMSIVAQELVKHPKVLEYTSIYETYLRIDLPTKVWLVNTNKLVRFYDGVDGLKTGYTSSSGYCLAATAKKNNMRIIAIVMGEPDSQTRNNEIKEMLDYVYAQYELDFLLSKDSIIKEEYIDKGKIEKAQIVPTEDINILKKKIAAQDNYTYDIKLDDLKAPIKEGDIVGTITITGNNIKKVSHLTVKETIEKAGFFRLYFRYLKDILTGNINF